MLQEAAFRAEFLKPSPPPSPRGLGGGGYRLRRSDGRPDANGTGDSLQASPRGGGSSPRPAGQRQVCMRHLPLLSCVPLLLCIGADSPPCGPVCGHGLAHFKRHRSSEPASVSSDHLMSFR